MVTSFNFTFSEDYVFASNDLLLYRISQSVVEPIELQELVVLLFLFKTIDFLFQYFQTKDTGLKEQAQDALYLPITPPYYILQTCEKHCLVGNCRLCVIAGNISPVDVITHVPILCEESDIPYIYAPSKEDLANAGATKRPTCCVLVLTKPTKGELSQEDQEKLKEDYDQVVSEICETTSSLF
uniref:H/ACA ribonucleoprotein complex subunit 2-like protein n=1 Tax=Nicotiana sylvestris TaxID=4096 RepID=A0A1U7VVV9_NICSY|nr:PREDICTED: H/ACA ribonucleoprotein complex subunit 2-like protein [Nicotiana sylvestris]